MVTVEAKGMQAIHMGDWKYIDNTPLENFPENRMKQFKSETPQFCSLAEYPGEKNILYNYKKKKAKQLLDELMRIREASSTR
jgi:hypothetical protein